MRKTRKTKATFDALGSLSPTEAGELLSAGATSTTIDWKNHEYDPSDIYIGDPPDTLGSGRIGQIETLPLGGTTIGPSVNPSIIIGGPGSTTTVDGVNITDLEKRVALLEEEIEELKKKNRKGGFRGKPKI